MSRQKVAAGESDVHFIVVCKQVLSFNPNLHLKKKTAVHLIKI
jgi:hypothetical protein